MAAGPFEPTSAPTHQPAPSSQWLARPLVGTYAATVADVFYLRAVTAFGSTAQGPAPARSVANLLQLSSEMDAKFAAPYLFAGLALPFVPDGGQDALSLLKRGTRERFDLWRLHLYYGFLLSQEGHYGEAARALAKAASLPGVPPYVLPLATRYAAEDSDPALGLVLLHQFASEVTDPQVLAALAERRAPLLYRLELADWAAAASHFAERHQRAARDAEELLAEAQHEPQDARRALALRDPWGAAYVLNSAGRAASSNTHRLLRVYRDADRRKDGR